MKNNMYNDLSIRDEGRVFDPFFDGFFFPVSSSCKDMERLMKTDVEENEECRDIRKKKSTLNSKTVI